MMTQLLFTFYREVLTLFLGAMSLLRLPHRYTVLLYTVLQNMQHDTLQQICCDVEHHLLCSWDHPAALAVGKMAHHTRLT